MKSPVYMKDGSVSKNIDLPEYFNEEVRPDLIKRAVLSEESYTYQPKGNYKRAGFNTSAKYVGEKEIYGTVKNKGIPHLPHEVQPGGRLGKVRRVPNSVGGHRAHPPKPEKILIERINKKEYIKAFKSALSASANPDIVENRMKYKPQHVPFVLSSDIEKISKTADVMKLLNTLKLLNAVNKWSRSNTRGALLITSSKELYLASRNIGGMDAVMTNDLKIKNLAPGTHPGRLLLISENALKDLNAKFDEIITTGLNLREKKNKK